MVVDRGVEWVTIRHAARIAGVHPNTIRTWLRDGRLRRELVPGKHGPTYRVALEDLPMTEQPIPEEASGSLALVLERLAKVEDARVEEARARAGAEARVEELQREVEELRRRLRREE